MGVIEATPLLPNESSKLNLNGGSLEGYPDPENSSLGGRPVEKPARPERKYLATLSVIFMIKNLCSDLRSLGCVASNVPTIDSGNSACAREAKKSRKRRG